MKALNHKFLLLFLYLYIFSIYSIKSQNYSTFNCNYDNSARSGSSLRSHHARSFHGNIFTPSSNLHCLVIFIGFNDADSTDNLTDWPYDSLPDWAKGDDNELLNKSVANIGSHENLSYWYSVMSDNQFFLTGEVFPEQININPLPGNYLAMNQAVFNYINTNYPNFNWSRFDNRINRPDYEFDNSQFADTSGNPARGDSIIDYVVMVYRELSDLAGGYSHVDGTHTVNTTFSGDSVAFTIDRDGFTLSAIGNGQPFNGLFIHELAHELYDSPHYFGANDAVGQSYYCQYGWGMMGGWMFPVANAWERWWLDWINPQFVTSDGSYTINDYMTTNDAIRIPIPHAPAHYLWIENHQLIHALDRKNGYATESPIQEGLYCYITTIGEDHNNPHDVDNNSSNTNRFKVLTALGNYDYSWDGASMMVIPGAFKGVAQPVFEKVIPNPITGQNDLTLLRMDFDGNDNNIHVDTDRNGQCDNCPPNEQKGVWAVKTAGVPTANYAQTGSVQDAFRVGDAIGLNGNIPALNFPFFDLANEQLGPFYLNGLSVRVTHYDSINKTYTIAVDFDDWQIDKDQRWCGDIFLPQQEELTISQSTNIHLDRSGTPTRRTPFPGTTYFSNSTQFTCLSGSYLTMNPHSTLKVDNQSAFLMEPYSRMDVFFDAALEVQNGGTIRVKPNANLNINPGGRLVVRSGGTLIVEAGADLVVESNGSIQVEPGGTLLITDPSPDHSITYRHSQAGLPQPQLRIAGTLATADHVDFHFQGDGGEGLLVFQPGANIQLGQNSRFRVSGTSANQKLVEVRGTSALVEEGWAILENCKITYTAGGRFGVRDGLLNASGITLEQSGTVPLATGLHVENSDADIRDCTFNGLAKGLALVDVPAISPDHSKTKIVPTGNTYMACQKGVYIENNSKDVSIESSTFEQCGNGLHAASCNIVRSYQNKYHNNDHAVQVNDIYAFYSDADYMDQGSHGIDGGNANVFIRNRTIIQNFYTGVWMNTTGPDPSKLTIGDVGCGWIRNNKVGIEGYDLVLSIDAEVHACNRGNCPKVIPNRFDDNDMMFSLCYSRFVPADIQVKGNYWGNQSTNPLDPGLPLSKFLYHTGTGKFCSKANIPVIDKHMEHMPAFCTLVSGPQADATDKIPYLRSRSIIQAPGSKQTITQDFNRAYADFTEENYTAAQSQFELIGLTDIEEESYRGIDEQQVRVARALSRVSAAHLTASGKEPAGKTMPLSENNPPITKDDPWFRIRPNPANQRIFVNFDGSGIYQIQLTDILGRRVYQATTKDQQLQVNVEQLDKGLYILKVDDLSRNKTSLSKVMLQ